MSLAEDFMVSELDQILEMIASGQISAEEGAHLLDALSTQPAAAGTEASAEANIAALRRRFRWMGYLPLGVGLIFLLISTHWLQTAWLGAHYFLFILALLPLGISLALIALGASQYALPWLFADIKQPPGEKPSRLVFGFPLPVKAIGWILKRISRRIDRALNRTDLDEIFIALQNVSRQTPLSVQVNDEDGTRVDILIG